MVDMPPIAMVMTGGMVYDCSARIISSDDAWVAASAVFVKCLIHAFGQGLPRTCKRIGLLFKKTGNSLSENWIG